MGLRSIIAGWLLERRSLNTMDPLLALILRQDPITREQAMSIPAFAACVRFITQTVAGLPVKLYRDTGGETKEVPGDPRPELLNSDTGDTLNGWQFKQSLSEDLLIEGGGYAYIKRRRNRVLSLHYVERRYISFLPGTDPIEKRCGIMVGGKRFYDFEFVKATRASKDGVRGAGILEESQLAFAIAYNTMKYENALVKKGGNHRGFLKAEKKLEQAALDKLEARWEKYNKQDSSGLMVLNAGIDFKETSATPEQLQINERKKSLSGDVCGLFGLSPGVIGGAASDDEYAASVKTAVLPVLSAIEAALDHDLLLESEKEQGYYFAFDTKALLRGSIEKRYKAYRDGIESNVLQIDEARYLENLPPLGLTFVKLGLQDVLYDPVKKIFFVPNTGATGNMETPPDNEHEEGGEKIES